MDTQDPWLDCLSDGFVAVDAQLRVKRCNTAFRALPGVSGAALDGRDLFDAVPGLRVVEEVLRAAVSRGSACILETRLAPARSHEIRVQPLPDGGLAVLFVDLGPRVSQGQRLGEELSRLAHDMRNPLAPLRTSLELLKRPTVPEATKERARGIMDRQIVELVGQIDRLQCIARSLSDELAEPDMPRTEVAPTTASTNAHDAGARVLLADDSPLVRQSIVAFLQHEGYEVRTVSDGMDAVAAAAQWHPRYVLLDLHMPRLSGMEAAKRLRESHPAGKMVLVMMSGVALDESWRAHAAQAGFDLCVDKSAEPAEWLAAMRAAGARA